MMTTEEIRAMKKLNTTEEGFRKIQEAHKLFSGLWDDDAFIELWESIPEDACTALFRAVDKITALEEKLAESTKRIERLQIMIHNCAERLVHEYAENGNATTKEVGIKAVGDYEFYAMLVEGGYDLTDEDREDIATLLRLEGRL